MQYAIMLWERVFRFERICRTVVMQLAKTTMYCAEISMSGMSGDVGLIFAVQKISRSTTLYYIRTYGKSVSPQGPVELVLMAKIFPFPTVLRLHSLTHFLNGNNYLPSLVFSHNRITELVGEAHISASVRRFLEGSSRTR